MDLTVAGFVHVPDATPTVIATTPVDATLGDDAHVVPLLVNTLPKVPAATAVTALVPLPIKTAFAVNVAAPVPPFATGT
jgi:hypothetical protein